MLCRMTLKHLIVVCRWSGNSMYYKSIIKSLYATSLSSHILTLVVVMRYLYNKISHQNLQNTHALTDVFNDCTCCIPITHKILNLFHIKSKHSCFPAVTVQLILVIICSLQFPQLHRNDILLYKSHIHGSSTHYWPWEYIAKYNALIELHSAHTNWIYTSLNVLMVGVPAM